MAAAFSPRGTYLATFQRTRPDAGNTEKNLKARRRGPSAERLQGWRSPRTHKALCAWMTLLHGHRAVQSGLLAAFGAALRGHGPLCGSCGTGARGSRR